jgi:hypothetical protein
MIKKLYFLFPDCVVNIQIIMIFHDNLILGFRPVYLRPGELRFDHLFPLFSRNFVG